MPFVPERVYNDTETRKRTSDSYVKFSPDYRVVLRMLNPEAKLVWKHWVQEANKGRGWMINCPNISSQVRPCPLEKEIAGLPKTDPTYMERRAKQRFIVNVLDRTPYTVCNACNTDTPKAKGGCTNCGADISKNEFAPLNRVKLLESGPQLFVGHLKPIEEMQQVDYPESTITDYDIVFQTQGTGRDRKILPLPSAPSVLEEGALDDPETPGEPQKLFDLDRLSEPNSLEEIEILLAGGGVEELAALHGDN